MKRILRAAAVTAALLGMQHAWALGLGEAVVSSDMSSPLHMTVPLVGVAGSGVDPESLKVDVPREVEHETLGFPDPIRPRDLRVRLVGNGTGGAAITVTTTSPTREPVLRFLLRVVWPGGQRLREYELIIDPPVIARPVRRDGALPSIVQGPAAVRRSAPARVATPRPAAPPQAGRRYGPVAFGDTLHAIARAAYAERSADLESVMQAIVSRNSGAFVNADPARLLMGAFLNLPDAESLDSPRLMETPAASTAASARTAVVSGDRTYTVARGDTLYAIARQVVKAEENLADVVRALYENNPNAFVGGDMDRLQAGAQLRLPHSGEAPLAPAAPAVPAASDSSSAEQVAALRSSVEAADAQLSEEQTSQSDLRQRLDGLIAQMESLRARDAQLSARAEALSGELERKNAAISAALPAVTATVETRTPVTESLADTASAPQALVAAPAEQAAPAPVAAKPAADDRPVRTRPTRRWPVRESAPEPGVLGFLGPLASGPLLWLAVGLFVVGILVLIVVRVLRAGQKPATAQAAPRQRADEEATALKLAEMRELHTESGRFEAAKLEAAAQGKSSTVHLTDAARAGNLAKEAAVHLAYEDYKAAKACIVEAIRLDPHRDEHKMVLVTVYECTGEHETARAIVDDLVARREQLPGELRQQVEQLRQGAAE